MTLGLIGAGRIGTALARLAVAAGLEVVVSNSRGPDTLAGLVAELGGKARAGTPEDAAATDVVVVTIPFGRRAELPVAALDGRIVLDTMNYYPERDGTVAALDDRELTSSELVQRELPGSHVVKVFNNIDYVRLERLARPSGAADRTALPIAGDDDAVKHRASRLIDRLGYDVHDTGPLAESWRFEPHTDVYVRAYLGHRPEDLAADEMMRWMAEHPGLPRSAQQVADLVGSTARRAPADARERL
jgi:8-hydroxy-5-deazaflavin:NADPH oxidoreductase